MMWRKERIHVIRRVEDRARKRLERAGGSWPGGVSASMYKYWVAMMMGALWALGHCLGRLLRKHGRAKKTGGMEASGWGK